MRIRHLHSAGEIAGTLIAGGDVYAIDLNNRDVIEVRYEMVDCVLKWYHSDALFIEVYEEDNNGTHEQRADQL